MQSRFFSFLMITAHILSINCRHLAPTAAIVAAIPPQQFTMALQLGGSVVESRIGSSPPSCEHKCYGCSPCEATQVPTNSAGHVNVRIQESNYEPEGWKCKCGLTFYNP